MNFATPEQVFTALGDGKDVYWSEDGSSDWTPLNQKSQLNFSDLYSGFLKFRVEDLPKINMPIEITDTQYFSAFVRHEGSFEIYRVGTTKTRFYALKLKRNVRSENYFSNIDVFAVNTDGSLKKVFRTVANDWVFSALETARKANRNREYNQILQDTGFFSSKEYGDHKRRSRRMGGM